MTTKKTTIPNPRPLPARGQVWKSGSRFVRIVRTENLGTNDAVAYWLPVTDATGKTVDPNAGVYGTFHYTGPRMTKLETSEMPVAYVLASA